jgi:predicted nucleic acid-binding protein
MTSWVVSDSGVLIASVLREKHTAEAQALLRQWRDQKTQIAAPHLFHYEIVASLRKNVYRRLLEAEIALNVRDKLLNVPVQLIIDNSLLKRGYELATELNRPTAYDAQYLAVAEHLSCEFWTADERLFNAVSSQLTWVKWIGDFERPQ